MIAIARKQKQNSAYTTKARPVRESETGLDLSAWKFRQLDLRHLKAADLNPPRVCASKQFPPAFRIHNPIRQCKRTVHSIII
jgi:hypothetical protein